MVHFLLLPKAEVTLLWLAAHLVTNYLHNTHSLYEDEIPTLHIWDRLNSSMDWKLCCFLHHFFLLHFSIFLILLVPRLGFVFLVPGLFYFLAFRLGGKERLGCGNHGNGNVFFYSFFFFVTDMEGGVWS